MIRDRLPIYLDIETIPGQQEFVKEELLAEAEETKSTLKAPANYKDPEAIEKYLSTKFKEIDAEVDDKWRKTSFDGGLGQIACISVAFGDEAPINIYEEDWKNKEADVLARFYMHVISATKKEVGRRPVFVGHNVANFDLRFLYQRSIMLGVKPPSVMPYNVKPWDDAIFDTMTAWAGFNKTVKLDKLCRIFGIAQKGAEIGEEIDGSQVWDYVQRGEIAKVALYCGGDVERCRGVYKRLNFLD